MGDSRSSRITGDNGYAADYEEDEDGHRSSHLNQPINYVPIAADQNVREPVIMLYTVKNLRNYSY
jgi:hypothetical protein